MRKLRPYLARNKEFQKDFAIRANLPQSAVSRLCNDGDVTSLYWARVMWATNGEVTPLDYYPSKRGRPPGKKGKG